MKRITLIILFFALCSIAFCSGNDTIKSFNSKITVGSSWYSGNVNKYDFTSRYYLERIDSSKQIEFDSRYYALFSGKVKSAEELSGSLRFEYKPYKKLCPFGTYGVYRNQFRNIDYRNEALLGLKYTLFFNKKEKISLSTAALYENSNYTKLTIDGQTKSERLRFSFRPKIKLFGKGNFSIVHQTYFKFTLDNFNDYSIESSTTISYRVIKSFNLAFNHNLIFDKIPMQIDSKKISASDNVFIWTLEYNF